MKQKASDILIRFAKARENAYRSARALSMDKLESISKIKRVAEFFRNKPQQHNAVIQCESDILRILPHPESRFAKLRETMINLIEKAHGSND